MSMTLVSLGLSKGPADSWQGAAAMGSSTCREGLLRGGLCLGKISIFFLDRELGVRLSLKQGLS